MLSVLRFVAGLAFLEHGTAKLLGFPPDGDVRSSASVIADRGAGHHRTDRRCADLQRFVHPPAAFILSGDMAVAYFMAHFPKSFFPAVNGGDAAILYCFIFFYLFVAGAGVWSLDRLRVTTGPPRHSLRHPPPSRPRPGDKLRKIASGNRWPAIPAAAAAATIGGLVADQKARGAVDRPAPTGSGRSSAAPAYASR